MKKDAHVRKLTRVSSHSFSLVIPKEIIERYGWREKQKLVLEDKGRGHIVLRDWKKR